MMKGSETVNRVMTVWWTVTEGVQVAEGVNGRGWMWQRCRVEVVEGWKR